MLELMLPRSGILILSILLFLSLDASGLPKKTLSVYELCPFFTLSAVPPSPGNLAPAYEQDIAPTGGGPPIRLRLPEVRYEVPPFLVVGTSTLQPERGPALLRPIIPQPKPFSIPASKLSLPALESYLRESPRFRGRFTLKRTTSAEWRQYSNCALRIPVKNLR